MCNLERELGTSDESKYQDKNALAFKSPVSLVTLKVMLKKASRFLILKRRRYTMASIDIYGYFNITDEYHTMHILIKQ